MKIVKTLLFCTLLFNWAPAKDALADPHYPDHQITLLTSSPSLLTGMETKETLQMKLLKILAKTLGQEMGVEVKLESLATGGGVLAASKVANSHPNGYTIGALGTDCVIVRVEQGYAPYTRDDLSPVGIGWHHLLAIVAHKDLKANDLIQLSAETDTVTLAYAKFAPLSIASIMALEAAQKVGITMDIKGVPDFNLQVLLDKQADLMVVPLAYYKNYSKRDQLKVLTVLTEKQDLPILEGLPTLKSQNIKINCDSFFAFFLPPNVEQSIKLKLYNVFNKALKNPEVSQSMLEAGVYLEKEVPFLELESFLNTKCQVLKETLESISVPQK